VNSPFNRHAAVIMFSAIIYCLAGIGSAKAAMYTYIDSSNVVHFTNVPTSIKYKPLFWDYNSYNHTRLSRTIIGKKVRRIADKYGVDPALIMAMIKVESDYMPYAVSHAGAIGLMQLMPSTVRNMRVDDLYIPENNIKAGVKHFKYLYNLFKGNYIKAIAAYNAGKQAVIKYNGIPPYPETQWYVTKVLKTFWKMKGYTER